MYIIYNKIYYIDSFLAGVVRCLEKGIFFFQFVQTLKISSGPVLCGKKM